MGRRLYAVTHVRLVQEATGSECGGPPEASKPRALSISCTLGLGLRVYKGWGLGFRVFGLGSRVWGSHTGLPAALPAKICCAASPSSPAI